MNTDLSGRRALVCGSSQGIGLACAVELANLGASVTLLARDEVKLASIRASLPSPRGQKHEFAIADFARTETVHAAIRPRLSAGETFHILINNAGGPAPGPLIDAAPDALSAAFAAHVLCAQILASALTPGMRDARYGRIINIISTSVKQPIPNLGVSNTIRGAMASWAKTLANELGPHGITVNNILPGYTSTERLASLIKNRAAKNGTTESAVEAELKATIPAGRFASPEEIAAAAGFLASPAASYINGINLPVDGGRLGTL